MVKFKKKTMFIVLACIVIVFFVSFATVKAIKSKNDNGILVKVAKIEKQDIESNIFTSGTVVSKKVREISADLTGKVKEVLVDEGDKVKKGQILAELDSSELEYQLKQAQIELEIAEDRLKELQEDDRKSIEVAYKNAEILYNDAVKSYENKKVLYEAGAVSRYELEAAKSSMDKVYNEYILAKKNYEEFDSEAEIRAQQKKVESSRLLIDKYKKDLEKTKIVSPIDGTVTEVMISELSIVSPNTIIFVVQDIENLEVVTNISEYDISRIKLGQKVKVTGEGVGDEEYEGIVKHISPNAVVMRNGQSTETVVEVKIDICDKDTNFKPNFSANIEINTAKKDGALVIPYEAIYSTKDGKKVIYTVVDGRAKENIIETGIEGDMVVEVIGKGLKEGDEIILNPTEKIKDNTPVKVNRGMKK